MAIITGTSSDDIVGPPQETTSDDTISTFAGNDRITTSGGFDTIDAGIGNDVLLSQFSLTQGYNASMGDGNDFVNVSTAVNSIFNLGAGIDVGIFRPLSGVVDTITLGAGSDVVQTAYQSGGTQVFTDFQAGAGGDSLQFVSWFLGANEWWTPLAGLGNSGLTNPFGAGVARLVDAQGGAQLQVRSNTSASWNTIATFQGLVAAQFTAANFLGWSPTGAAAPSTTINLTESIEIFGTVDTYGDDVINGTAAGGYIHYTQGNDIIYAGAGNDYVSATGGVASGLKTIYAGDGDDQVVIAGVTFGTSPSGGPAGETVRGIVFGGAGNDTLGGGSSNDQLYGDEGSDIIVGGGGNDVLSGGSGSDQLFGGAGFDTALYSGLFRGYSKQLNNASGTVAGGVEGGTDTLSSLELVRFKDGFFIFDPNGVAAQVTRLYDLVLHREPDQPGLDYWVDRIEDFGQTLKDVAFQFLISPEFQRQTGSLSDSQYVQFLYQNGLGRTAGSEEVNYWTYRLSTDASRADLLVEFSESAEHRTIAANAVNKGFFNTDDNYQAVALLYDSFANRLPDEAGLIYWSEQLKTGAQTLSQVSQGFAQSAEFRQNTDGLNNVELVRYMYRTTLDREAQQQEVSFWAGRLDSGMTRGELLLNFSQSQEHANLLSGATVGGIQVLGSSSAMMEEPDQAPAFVSKLWAESYDDPSLMMLGVGHSDGFVHLL